MSFGVHLPDNSAITSYLAGVCRALPNRKSVTNVKWNCNGSLLASVSAGVIRLWEIDGRPEGTEIRSFDPYGTTQGAEYFQAISGIAWHPSQTDLIASASDDRTVRIWDARVPDGAVAVLRPPVLARGDVAGSSPGQMGQVKLGGQAFSVAWRPGGDFLLVGDREDNFYTLDFRRWPASFTRIAVCKETRQMVNTIAWSANGQRVIMATTRDKRGVVEICRFDDGSNSSSSSPEPQAAEKSSTLGQITREFVVPAHAGTCLSAVLDPANRQMATSGEEGIVALWDMEDLDRVLGVERLEGNILQLDFSYDGTFLASAGDAGIVDVMDTSTGEQMASFRAPGEEIMALAWHPQELLLASCSNGRDRRDAIKLVRFSTKAASHRSDSHRSKTN